MSGWASCTCAKSGCESSSREDMIPLRGRVRARGCLLCCTLYVVEAARREVLLTLCYLYMCSIILVDVVYMCYLGPRARASAAPRACVTACFFDACFFDLCVSVKVKVERNEGLCLLRVPPDCSVFLFTTDVRSFHPWGRLLTVTFSAPAHNLWQGRRPVRPAWRPRSLHPSGLRLQTLCPSSRTLVFLPFSSLCIVRRFLSSPHGDFQLFRALPTPPGY